MDQREKIDDFEEMLRSAISGMLADVMTCMPVEVVSWDGNEMTVSVQPTQQTRVQLSNGSYAWINQGVMIHCPIIFFSGGGYTITAPPAPGQEGVAFFSNRSIDEWWMNGGIQKRKDLRTHDRSDGFVLVGPRSKPRVLSAINPHALEIRSDDGTAGMSFGLGGILSILAPGGLSIDGDVTVDGVLGTSQIPTPSITSSNFSIPIVLGGVIYYMRLSTTP
jgi:hypothetical protein